MTADNIVSLLERQNARVDEMSRIRETQAILVHVIQAMRNAGVKQGEIAESCAKRPRNWDSAPRWKVAAERCRGKSAGETHDNRPIRPTRIFPALDAVAIA
jgi:hypothetical protein